MAPRRQIRRNCLLPKAAQGDVICGLTPTFRTQRRGHFQGRAVMNIQISPGQQELLRAAREAAYSTPLEDFHPGAPQAVPATTRSGRSSSGCGERTRCTSPPKAVSGPSWSITRYHDIMQVDFNAAVFSFAQRHGYRERRRPPTSRCRCSSPWTRPSTTLSARWSARSSPRVAWPPREPLIRERAERSRRPAIGETFDWVDRVSIELTTQMLATLFDFPWEERRKLTRWSDVATALPRSAIIESRRAPAEMEMRGLFRPLWNERVNAEPTERPYLDAGPRRGHANRAPRDFSATSSC